MASDPADVAECAANAAPLAALCLIARLHVRSIEEMDEIIDRIGDKAETNTAIVKAQTLKRRLPPL